MRRSSIAALPRSLLRTWRRTLLTLPVAALSCGTSSANTAQAQQQACGDYAHDFCAAQSLCDPESFAVQWADEPTCEQRMALYCTRVALPVDFGSAAAVQSCAAALAQPSCSASGWIPAACSPSIRSLANGASCTRNEQCSSGLCSAVTSGICGVCSAPQNAPPAAGDACLAGFTCWDPGTGQGDPRLFCCGPDLCCAGNVDCSKEPWTKCTPGAGEGQPCNQPGLVPNVCGYAASGRLECVGPPYGPGKCEPEATSVGQACDPAGVSQPKCDGTRYLQCDPKTKQCAEMAVLAPGQSCGGSAGVCGAGSVCDPQSLKCLAPLPDGAPCDPSAFAPRCTYPAVCVSQPGDDAGAGACTVPAAGCR